MMCVNTWTSAILGAVAGLSVGLLIIRRYVREAKRIMLRISSDTSENNG